MCTVATGRDKAEKRGKAYNYLNVRVIKETNPKLATKVKRVPGMEVATTDLIFRGSQVAVVFAPEKVYINVENNTVGVVLTAKRILVKPGEMNTFSFDEFEF